MSKSRSGGPRTIPEGKSQVNFNILNELYDKVAYIAYHDKKSHSDIYNEAVAEYIARFEKKHGKIKPRPSGS